ncbi:unnamed protein product [Effrenium voratum]|nr:unnamed protein product [Effrenium voratum]
MAFRLALWSALGSALLAGARDCSKEDCEEAELLQHKKWSYNDLQYIVLPVSEDSDTYLRKTKPKVALTTRGGGTRAQSGVTGQLRALEDMGLLDEVDQMQAISGAGWAMAPYLFAPKEHFSSRDLLGETTFGKLDDLSLAAIATPKGQLIATCNASLQTYLGVAAQIGVAPEILWNVVVGATYLCPFKVNAAIPAWPFPGLCTNDNEDQLWVEKKEQLLRIKGLNRKLKVDNALVQQRTKVSHLLFQSTLISPEGYLPQGDKIISVRFSPDFSGTPFFADEETVDFEPINTSKFSNLGPLDDVLIGGGLVDNFAFMATEEPRKMPETVPHKFLGRSKLIETPVTLQQAVGYSSAALALLGLYSPEGLNNFTGGAFAPPIAHDPFLFTGRRPYWPISLGRSGDDSVKNFYLGDGGSVENGGLPEAIRSGAKCTIVLLNNQRPIDTSVVGDWCNPPAAVLANPLLLLGPNGIEGDAATYDYFGIALPIPNILYLAGFDYSNNHIFATSDIFPVMCEAVNLRTAGKPGVVYKKLTTIENTHWGIEAGKKVGVTFVFTEVTQDWLDELPEETSAAIAAGAFDTTGNVDAVFSPWPFSFPHLSTNQPQGENAEFVSMSNQQANLYSSLTEYTLRVNEDKVRQCMGLDDDDDGYY